MESLDLDKLRAEREAARREQKRKTPAFTFKGKSFKLPVELSLEITWALEEGITSRQFARMLLGDGPYEEFMALEPDREDWRPVDRWLKELYLTQLEPTVMGESPASDAS